MRRAGQARQQGSGSKPSPTKKRSSLFGKGVHMSTAKAMMDKKRQKENIAAVEEFLGAPPKGRGSVEVRLVIPGEHMIPRDLDNPARLDGIRRGCKVWITNIEPHIFKICSDSVLQLRHAIREINDVIHDLRLASECLHGRLMVQKPCRNTYSLEIRFRVGSRPCTMGQPMVQSRGNRDFSKAVDAHTTNMWTELLSHLDVLACCGTSLQMKVNFGSLKILQKQRELGEFLSLDDFARAMKVYSGRRGARLDTWLPNPRMARDVCLHLVDAKTGICSSKDSVKKSHSLTVKVNDQELLLKAVHPAHGSTQLSAERLAKIDDIPRLNYNIAAPDMSFDWNLQVDSFEDSNDMPSIVLELTKGILLKIPRTDNAMDISFDAPSLEVPEPGEWCDIVSETKLKTSIIIPIKLSPYVVEVSVIQKWKGLRPRKPEVGWSIELYGVHWDEAVNEVRPGERKKDWGPNMEKIWSGTEREPNMGFKEFIQTVLDVQAALDDVEFIEI